MNAAQQSFTYSSRTLFPRLTQAAQGISTGYWQFQVNSAHASHLWYLGFVQGKVVYLGPERLSWNALLGVLNRFILRLRTSSVQRSIKQLETEATPEQMRRLGSMLSRMDKLQLLSYDEAVQALRLSILMELEQHLFSKPGQAEFVQDYELLAQSPIAGFNLDTLLVELQARQKQWQGVQAQIRSLNAVPQLNQEAIVASNLSPSQQQQLTRLMASPKSLKEIAEELARDSLDVARMFANLARNNLVNFGLSANEDFDLNTDLSSPEVFVVDDSPLLLKQFQNLVEHWGYRVNTCSDALKAVPTMLQTIPAVIFLDINMPEVSGFELIKQIRRQPQLASIPLVMLTGEKSMSNQWRAQWANCKFLAKPRASDDVSTFRQELRELLREVVPLEKDTLV
ncbi:MAG: response regulator [Synechococcaceae cyanobacterium SM2_3_1]|nr:response regulator [Synechococcaceae cyanobacterium SM2_3_1]